MTVNESEGLPELTRGLCEKIRMRITDKMEGAEEFCTDSKTIEFSATMQNKQQDCLLESSGRLAPYHSAILQLYE